MRARFSFASACLVVFLPSTCEKLALQSIAHGQEQGDSRQEQHAPPVAAFRESPAEGSKYSYIDRTGTTALKAKYDYARDFVDGLAQVRLDGKWGFIDVKGSMKFVLPSGTESAYDAQEGMIWYRRAGDGRWGLLDENGRSVIEPKYDDVYPFSDGMAAVNLGAKFQFPGRMIGGKWGFVDKQGTLVVPIKNEFVVSYSEGLGRISGEGGNGFVDKTGKLVIGLSDFAGSFRDGFAPVHEDSKTRYIDRQGKTAFSIDGWAEEFHDGLAVLSVKGGKAASNEHHSYGYINPQGKVTIPTRFGEALAFSEGLAAVRDKKTTVYGAGDKWAYIDKTGAYRIQFQFNEAHPFHGGVALVHIGGTLREVLDASPYWEGGEWWLIDQSGKKLKRSWLESKP